MTHGAGLIIGVFAIWSCASFGGGWSPAVALSLGAAAALLVAASAARMGVLDREGARVYTRSGQSFVIALTRWSGSMVAAFGVVARTLGARAAQSGFVRLKLRPTDDVGLAAVIETLNARPGILVVDADPGSLLAHALNEGAVDVATLKALETRALGVAREAGP